MHFHFTRDHFEFFSSGRASEIHVEYRKQTEKYADSLRIQTALRARWPGLPPAMLAACMAQFALQERGAEKCGLPDTALYTGPALEMASSRAAARLHADLLAPVLRRTGGGRLLEIAAGIGADSIALAGAARSLIAIESDPLHALLLGHNLRAAGKRNALVLRGEAERLLHALRIERIDAVFADPARRTGARRNIGIEDYSPPFSFFAALPAALPMLIKIAPAAEAPPDWGVAAVAAGGECKELLLHRGLDLPPRCALDADSGARWISGDTRAPIAVAAPAWLIEPHPAIIRTGAVAQYCREQGCEPIDPRIAYAWSDRMPPRSDWHQRFRILRVENYNRKELQRIVAELRFGPSTEIKKRGFPDTPDEVRKRLRLSGTRSGVIILTRRGDGHLMIFGER
jgi:hypothetical protein